MIGTWLTSRPWPLLLAGGIFCLGLVLPFVYTAPQDEHLVDSPYLRIDPAKMVIDDNDPRIPCGECHVLEFEAWRETPHAEGFDELHRSEQAQAILDRMDFRLSKRESLCLRCHYTAKIVRDEPRAVAGVSCESCHGAARDWLNVHNDYGGATHDTESPEHKQQRLQQSTANGMLRPSDNLYAVAANCFECHTVPQEKLINVGGHPSGSNFELVDWSKAIRHNFVHAQWSSDQSNREPSEARKRMMYVIGRALDYEYSIRGMAASREEGIYAKAMERRTKLARRELDKILRVADIPEIAQALQAGRDARLVPNNEASLTQIADRISQATQAFARAHDGAALAALDPVIRGEAVELPEEAEVSTEAEVVAEADGETAGTAETASGDAGTGDAGGTTGGAATSPATGGSSGSAASGGAASSPSVQVVGEARRRPAWFTSSNHAVLGPSGCSCHIDQQGWWQGDKHSASADPLLNESPRAVQIAGNYGLSRSQMKRGNQICMSCHGTVITGDEAEEVFDGVSCESCHGPGGDYQPSHPTARYAGSASKGMVQLEQAQARAQNCARCHHITDERLISSGHSTGQGFNIAQRNQQIKHWAAPTLDGGQLSSAFQQATSGRAIPNVPVAQVTAPVQQTQPRSQRQAATATRSAPVPPPPPPPTTRPVAAVPTTARAAGAPTGTAPAGVPPQPVEGDASTAEPATAPPPATGAYSSASTEDILLTVKRKLEALYRTLGRSE